MNIDIKGTHMELTEAIQNYVRSRLQAVEKVIGDPSAYAHVEVGKDSQHHQKGDVFKAEVEIRSRGESYYAVVMKDDLYAAIDEVKDEILEKIKAGKDKATSRFRKGARKVKQFIKGFWPNKKEEENNNGEEN